MTRPEKLFVGEFELSKGLPIKSVEINAEANGLVEGVIRFYVDEVNIDKNGNIRLGEYDEEIIQKFNKDNPGSFSFERSLIF